MPWGGAECMLYYSCSDLCVWGGRDLCETVLSARHDVSQLLIGEAMKGPPL